MYSLFAWCPIQVYYLTSVNVLHCCLCLCSIQADVSDYFFYFGTYVAHISLLLITWPVLWALVPIWVCFCYCRRWTTNDEMQPVIFSQIVWVTFEARTFKLNFRSNLKLFKDASVRHNLLKLYFYSYSIKCKIILETPKALK